MKKPNLNNGCPRCGCKGIHACMGDNKVLKTVDMSTISKYNSLEDAINHIRISEAKRRQKGQEERKDDKRNRGS